MTTTGYRIVYLLLATALGLIIAGAILFIPSGDPEQLPAAVQSYSPRDGDIVIQPVKVVLDLASDYDVRFIIDGVAIPPEEVDSIGATGRHQFVPGPGKIIERWASGDHTVVATFAGGPNEIDVGTLVWTFRVQ